MSPVDNDTLYELLRDMDTRFTAAVGEVKSTALETKKELSGQIFRVQKSVDGVSERVNVQNGRVAKLETARDVDRAAQKEREKLHEKRWQRIRWWGKLGAACFIAGFGSLTLVVLTHIWK